MSGPLAGAEMMTFCAPASRCLAASSRFVKRPVDSITTSAPSSLQGSFAGVCLGGDPHALAVDDQGVLFDLDAALERAVHGVVLEQVTKRRGVGEVVDGDELDVGAALDRSADGETTDAAEAIDAHSNSHSVLPK